MHHKAASVNQYELLCGLADCDGELCLASARGIVKSIAAAVAFAGLEVEPALDAVGESNKPGFAVDIGADLKIELVEAAETISNVHFDGRRIHRLAGVVCDREVGGTGAKTAVDRRDGMGIGILSEGWGHEQQ